MRKTFKLEIEGRHRDRTLEAIKHELRKYMRRERRRDLPAGADYWHIDCRFGTAEESAQAVHPSALAGLLDTAHHEGAAQVYVELLARPAKRSPRAEAAPGDLAVDESGAGEGERENEPDSEGAESGGAQGGALTGGQAPSA